MYGRTVRQYYRDTEEQKRPELVEFVQDTFGGAPKFKKRLEEWKEIACDWPEINLDYNHSGNIKKKNRNN